MTDVQPDADGKPDPSVTTPQPDDDAGKPAETREGARNAPARDRDPEHDYERIAPSEPSQIPT